jgi:hypothetical protein
MGAGRCENIVQPANNNNNNNNNKVLKKGSSEWCGYLCLKTKKTQICKILRTTIQFIKSNFLWLTHSYFWTKLKYTTNICNFCEVKYNFMNPC